VVKVSRPEQDRRFDLPVVGLRTLEIAGQCNVSALAVDPGLTLIVEKQRFLKRADDMGIAIVGHSEDEED
jgi:DUF1009 family protein